MTSATAKAEAKTAVSSLLERLDINRVVCVDDIYGFGISTADILGAVGAADPDTINTVFPEIGDSLAVEPDILNEKINRILENIDPAERLVRYEQLLIAQGAGDDKIKDLVHSSLLAEIVQADKLTSLNPGQWDTQEAEIIASATGHKTLILFDQDLKRSPGKEEQGIRYIEKLLNGTGNENIICGLLTHTATIDDQHQRWEEEATQHGINKNRFVLIAKEWVSKDSLGFARMLKLLAVCPEVNNLKQIIHEISVTASGTAATKVDEISIYDLEHIVFKLSRKEGLWEPDTLFRLFGIFHRIDARSQARGNVPLQELARKIRAISEIPTDSEQMPATSSWEIQKQELYESEDYLNRYHIPIDLGDIFIKTSGASTKTYILLNQPCDLMVRGNGERGYEANLSFTLAEIKRKDGSELSRDEQVIEYFGDEPGKKFAVDFKSVYHVPPFLLDLCVFNPEGKASIILSNECPPDIVVSWEKRYSRIIKETNRIIRRFNLKLIEGEGETIRKLKSDIGKEVPNLFGGGLFKGEIKCEGDNANVEYNCQRIKRLSRERAYALLMAYTAQLSRPAFEMDMGR